MNRRAFVHTAGALAAALASPATLHGAAYRDAGRRPLRRIGIQLYTLRDDARRDLERTLAGIANVGFHDVELLGSMNNFGVAPARLRAMLDGLGLRAPSTHVGPTALDDLDRQLDDAATLGHEYLIVASFPAERRRTLDDVHRWADRFNEAGAVARRRGVWLGFHNHAEDFAPVEGRPAFDAFVERTDPSVVRLQLDTGNLAMAGLDPLDELARRGDRYWSFHVKDVPRLGARTDTEPGQGALDFRRLFARIERIDEKHLFYEQESYPGAPLDSARRAHAYLAALEF